MYLTWLDSNSWLIEMAGKRILLDPWLVGSLTFGNATWLFKSDRLTPRQIPHDIDLILLSQGLEDHAHRPTLQQLDKQIPVVASPNAAKVVTALGYTQITTLKHGETTDIADRLEICAIPGSPTGPTTIENGYILRDRTDGTSLYYEPHGYHTPAIAEYAPIDVVITPTIDLKIPLLGTVIKGMQSGLQIAQWLQPQVILPTAAGGDLKFEGLLLKVLRAEGSPAEFRQLLAQYDLPTQVLEPNSWERFEVPLVQRAATNAANA